MQIDSTTAAEPLSAFTNPQEEQKHYNPYDDGTLCGQLIREIGKRIATSRAKSASEILEALRKASRHISAGGYYYVAAELNGEDRLILQFQRCGNRGCNPAFEHEISFQNLLIAGDLPQVQLH
jgi:hypothetical protein